MANQSDPVVAKYAEKMIDGDTGEPVDPNSGVQVEFFIEPALDYTLTEGGTIMKSHPKVKEIRKLEAEALALLREQEPFDDEEPQQPKDQTPAAQRAYKQSHEEWDARRVQYDNDLKERAAILTPDPDPEHPGVYIVRPAGRPVYVDREYIEIRVAGDRENIPRRPVMPADIEAHRAQYNRWKKGLEQKVAGIPLSNLTGMSKSLEKQLAYFNITTVEELAATSDSNITRIGPLLAIRKTAQDFMALRKGMAPVDAARKEAREATDEVRKLKAVIEEMKRQQKAS